MANTPSVQDVWNDPDFQGLPMEEKRKVLTNIDSDFQGLPQDQQDQVLGVHAVTTAPASSSANVIPAVLAALKPNLAEVGTAGLSSANSMADRIGNYETGKPNPSAQTLLELAANHPTQTALLASNLIPGVKPLSIALRVGANMAATAADPNTTKADVAGTGGIQALLESLPYGAAYTGPILKPILSKLSGVDAQAIQKLFDNPSLLFTGPTMDAAKAFYSQMVEKAGLSKTVSDNVLFGAGKTFVKNTLDSLQAGETIPLQTLIDARQTTGDLINVASRQGEDQAVKGFIQRQQLLDTKIAEQMPEFGKANAMYRDAASMDQFKNVVPIDAAGRPSPMKMLQMKYLLSGGGVGATPIVQGLGISAAGAMAQNPAVPKTAIQLLRQYILTQRQHGPS